PGNVVYYVASACDEISLNPAGDVNLIGFSVRSPFIRGTLDKLEIKPEFPGRGAYKTARFMYTKKDFTPEAREMMTWLIGSLEDQLVNGVASRRKLEPATVREIMDRGPLSADEALKAGLVDDLEDWYAFSDRLKKKAGNDLDFVSLDAYLKAHQPPSMGPRIAVITAVGAIARGRSGRDANPLFGGERMGSDTIAAAWRKVRKTSSIKAVVFRIDSPGGSAVASEIIRQEMERTAKKIPVVVSMSNYAASGGYWITCGARKIIADPATLTASIGVFGGHLNMDGFWRDKLGITFGRLDSNRNSAIYGGLEDWTDEQRAIVNRMLDRIYGRFTKLVAASRKMTPEQVDAMGEGRVFTGQQALDKGLVDGLGGFDEALAEAKKLAGISPETAVRLVDYPRPEPWWRRVLERGSGEDSTRQALTELEKAWRTGALATPGAVWQPPIYVR
ncbi:MAG TPA: signal peptide peptidase SppA, partial [Acidobacteria bacterium]|nr:signal peptide peptidase SppA [Acidobacteriota bacterium]